MAGYKQLMDYFATLGLTLGLSLGQLCTTPVTYSGTSLNQHESYSVTPLNLHGDLLRDTTEPANGHFLGPLNQQGNLLWDIIEPARVLTLGHHFARSITQDMCSLQS